MKLTKGLITAGVLLIASQVNAATIFAPTDGDVNFLFADLKGATLAMFDDSDPTFAGAHIEIAAPDIVGIFGPVNIAGDHIASNSLANTLTLTASDNFILGLFFDGDWFSSSSITAIGANAYNLSFNNGASLTLVDAQIMPAVPVPAAAWLFGSGLIGLVGIARRKTK